VTRGRSGGIGYCKRFAAETVEEAFSGQLSPSLRKAVADSCLIHGPCFFNWGSSSAPVGIPGGFPPWRPFSATLRPDGNGPAHSFGARAMAARSCEMAPSRSPTFSSLCRSWYKRRCLQVVLSALICAPRCASRQIPRHRQLPEYAASVVWHRQIRLQTDCLLERRRRLRQFPCCFNTVPKV